MQSTKNKPPSRTLHVARVLEAWSPTPSTRAIRVTKPAGVRLSSRQPGRSSRARRRLRRRGTCARPLSTASGPARGLYLEFAVRGSPSPFKRAFFALRPGDPVRLIGPGGAFFLEPGRPAVLIAGGIGITPFKSMLEDVAERESDAGVKLGSTATRTRKKSPSERARRHREKARGVEIVYTADRADAESGWRDRVGRIDAELVATVVKDMPGAVYYLAGPPGLIRQAVHALSAGRRPHVDVRLEVFRGYHEDDPGGRPAGGIGPRSWDAVYATQAVETMPWFLGELDPDLARAR